LASTESQKSSEYYLKNNEKAKEYWSEYYLKKKEKRKEYQSEFRLKNKEKVLQSQREYYLKNKEKARQSKREYDLKNKERVLQSKREYYLKNKEKVKEYRSEYYLKNIEKAKEYRSEYYLKNKEKFKERDTQKRKSIDKNYVRRKNQNWKCASSTKRFLEDAGEALGVTDLSSWYRVSRFQLSKKGGRSLLYKFPSLGFALKFAYPDYPWDMSKFSLRSKKSDQLWLATLMRKLLPDVRIVEDYRGHPSLKRKETNRSCELDIWIEEHNLALEYQGPQHFNEIPGSGFRDFEDQQRRDIEKKTICIESGITLVQIPYWWDGTIESLSSTLHQYLPHLFASTGLPPIPTELPLDYKENIRQSIKTIKMIMEGYDHNDENPEGWFMSEKLDGIRGYWDGEQIWSKKCEHNQCSRIIQGWISKLSSRW
jgi:hypothetical protein